MIRAHRAKAIVALVISATQTSAYNLFTAAGSPTAPTDVYLTINTGVVCERGILGTGFPAGSSIFIVNNGRVAGIGGAGATGVGVDISDNYSLVSVFGSNGGHAIETNVATVVDNTNGEIFGGGGGGGGSGATRLPVGGPYTQRSCGGGSGGGQGYNNAAGGAGGTSAASGFESGAAGTAGSSAAPGTGGIPGPLPPGSNTNFGVPGGTWGQPGPTGYPAAAEASGQYAGGLAGDAVKTNGAGVAITGGNNSTQIKGAVA